MARTSQIEASSKIRTLNTAEMDGVAGGFLIQEMMASLKLMNEILSNVSKTRSEISMTLARNSRA